MKESNAAATPSDSGRFSRALRSAILGPACVIFFAALLMLLMLFMLMKAVKWSEHSYAVLAQTRTCESLVIETQRDLRGFLLTGDPSFPASFSGQREKIDTAFDGLKRLVRDNSSQAIRADGLNRTKNIWLDHVKTMLTQRPGSTAADEWIKMGDGLMTDIHAQFQTFAQAEEGLHDQRLANEVWAERALTWVGGGLALVLAVVIGQMVRRQFLELAVDYRKALDIIEHRHTALLRSEADLEEQKEWFRVTLTSIGDGVIVTDPEGRIVFMNHESERLTGWTSVEALLKPLASVFRIVDEATHERQEDPVAQVFREKKVMALSNHTLLVSRLGEEFPIEDSAAPIQDAKGNVLGVVLVFHNATDMRRAQSALKSHSEELEKRVVERTTALQGMVTELEAFSYTVSHDLRSPLRAMQGFAQAVLEDYGDKLDAQGKNYLDRIKNAAERLDRLIQDLLSFTRVARQNAPLVPIDLDKTLRDIVATYPNLHSPAAEVEIEGSLPSIMGQGASLTQVLSNLLGNAAKFVREGTTPHIRVWSEDAGEYVRLWIEDNGIGIPPADHERIFQMFVQVNESRLYGGTGVGLAIVKKAVESMHGQVGLISGKEGDEGSRFWVKLIKAP